MVDRCECGYRPGPHSGECEAGPGAEGVDGEVALIVVAMLMSSISTPSLAAELVTADSVSITKDGVGSTLDVEFDKPLSRDDAEEKMRQYTSESPIAQNSETQKAEVTLTIGRNLKLR